jgi:hypothetical protein
MPKFIVSLDNEPLKSIQSTEPVITIGRLPENTISIVNMGVSRRHARIEIDSDGNYIISDLNSLNGTFVNSTKITRTVLSDGDKILIGQHTIQFDLGDSPASAEVESAPELKTKPVKAPEPEPEPEPSVTAAFSEPAELEPEKARAVPKSSPVLIETTKHVVYKLDKDPVTIGNSENDDIFVDGLFIDEGHISIGRGEQGLVLTSKKLLGTIKINGKKTRSHVLQHKDRIEIGTSTFRFMESE